VSFVLNPQTRAKVADATATRVLDAIEELGYRPNTLARSLVHGRTQTVGLVLPYLGSDYHAEIVYGVRDTLAEHGYHLLFMNASPGSKEEATAIDFLLQQRVDGILCFVNAVARNVAPRWLESIGQAELPAVVLDFPFYADAIDTVVSDDFGGMASAVEHLYGLGHRRICYICDDSPEEFLPIRSRSFVATCKRLGIDSERKIVYSAYSGQPVAGWVLRKMMNLLESNDSPTAFIGFNDYAFEDFLTLDNETRPRVPHDVSLVGYSDSHLARYANLTSVSQSPNAIGVAAVQRLMARMHDDTLPALRIDIPTSLVIRKSTAPPK
jgi:LacI family transcriptional regulator